MDINQQYHTFHDLLAPTTSNPIGIHLKNAQGCILTDMHDRSYIDLVAGFSVNNIGYGRKEVLEAIQKQAENYLHTMVYGEFIQQAQVELARGLVDLLPANLHSVYFTNSGSEAVEGAVKLAKRCLNRSDVFGFVDAYHGSTHGALSLMGDEKFRRPFRPLLPGVYHLPLNDFTALDRINGYTAAVIIEPVQAEAGVRVADLSFLKRLREKCDETGTMLIFDEVQTGFGRLGDWFALEKYGVVPDILVLGKAIGGGMPLAAFISSKERMQLLSKDPFLGHITTFGGHPVSCAAGKASLDILKNESVIQFVEQKEQLFRQELKHDKIKEIRGQGLLLAVELESAAENHRVIRSAIENGVLLDYFIFADDAFRITPPLTISEEEIKEACRRILFVLDQ